MLEIEKLKHGRSTPNSSDPVISIQERPWSGVVRQLEEWASLIIDAIPSHSTLHMTLNTTQQSVKLW